LTASSPASGKTLNCSPVEDGETGAIILLTPTTNWTHPMLDAFIIEKIHQERELRDTVREPLRIEIAREPVQEILEHREEEKSERGIAVIDFSI